MKIRKAKLSRICFIERSDDLPVTQRMLYLVRDDVKSQMMAMEARANGKFGAVERLRVQFEDHCVQVDGRFTRGEDRITGLEDRVSGLEHRMSRLEDRMTKLENRLGGVESKLHQLHLLLEEQNNRSKYVMDGLISFQSSGPT